MTVKEFAELLDGTQYGFNMFTDEQIEMAKREGFVIVYGASDDLVEFEGALCDEVGGVFGGGIITFDLNGTSDDGETHKNTIKAFWYGQCNDETRDYTAEWEYETDIPHEAFMIYELGVAYCAGIVFDIKDIL